MRISGKYVGTETQIFVLCRSKVNEQITIWLSRRVFICFHGEGGSVRIHLSRQTGKLARVSRILKQHYVMSVEAYGSDVLIFCEKGSALEIRR